MFRIITKAFDCNGTRAQEHLVCKRTLNHSTKLAIAKLATIESGLTLKRVCDKIRTYIQIKAFIVLLNFSVLLPSISNVSNFTTFSVLLPSISNVSNFTTCMSLNGQLCMTKLLLLISILMNTIKHPINIHVWLTWIAVMEVVILLIIHLVEYGFQAKRKM